MGNFSFIAQNTKSAIKNPWRTKTLCELQYVKDGKVVEKMRGIYNGYGAVDHSEPFRHEVLEPLTGEWKDITEDTKTRMSTARFSGEMWVTDSWDEMVERMFSDGGIDGLAAWELAKLDELVPLAAHRSKDDPGQGDFDEDDEDEDDDYPY